MGRLEDYRQTIEDAALPAEGKAGLQLPSDSNLEITPDWFLGLIARGHPNRDDPIEFVIDLCCKVCQMATHSGPFLFPEPDKSKIKEIKKKVGYIKASFTNSLKYLKRARRMSDYYSTGGPSPGEPPPITSQDIDLIEKVFDRAWRWHEYAWQLDIYDSWPPEKRTTPGRPAATHVNEVEWRLWQLLQCTGMKRRMASKKIEQLLGYYGLSQRPWESIEQRLIKLERSRQN